MRKLIFGVAVLATLAGSTVARAGEPPVRQIEYYSGYDCDWRCQEHRRWEEHQRWEEHRRWEEEQRRHTEHEQWEHRHWEDQRPMNENRPHY